MGLFDLLKEETGVKKTQEEFKEAEVVEKSAPAKKVKKEVKKETKKTSKPKVEKDKKAGYLYPFSIYTEGRLIDIDNYGFEDGKTYTDAEITKIMLAHKHYEFSGTMEYSFIGDDNVVVANAKQHKKG